MFLLLWEIIIVRISSVSCCLKYCAGHVSHKSNILMLCCQEYFCMFWSIVWENYGVFEKYRFQWLGGLWTKGTKSGIVLFILPAVLFQQHIFFARTMPEYISRGISCFIHSWHKVICMWCGSSWLQYPRTKQLAFLIYHTERWYQKLCKP